MTSVKIFKSFFAAALLCVASLVVFSSCEKEDDTTFMGLETEFISKTPNQHLEYDTDYYCKLDTLVNELVTVEQYVDGDVVFKEGDKVINKKPFSQELDLNAKFEAEPEVVYVLKKENLANVAMSSSNVGDETVEKKAVNTEFLLSTVKKNYGFVFNEGETVSVKTLYEKLSHNDTTFMHAAIKNVSYKEFDATLNEAISNADSTVYNVNIYFAVDVVKEDSVKETYKVRVPVVRIFKEAPAEAVTTIEDTEFKAEFATRENELYTVEQYVKGYFVTRLRATEIGRKMFKYDLNLNAKFTAEPKEVYVDSEAKLYDVSMKSSSNGDENFSDTPKDDFTLTSVTKNYEFLFNAGEKVTAETIYEMLSTDETTFDYVEIKSVSYKDFDARLNETETKEDNLVCDVTLYFNVEVVCDANSKLNKTYVVPVLVKRIFAPEKPDTYETVIENQAYEAEFKTAVKELYTVKQRNFGEFVTYMNNSNEVSRESFTRNLNLEAIFSTPGIVYVSSLEQLADVSLKASSKDGDKINSSDDKGFTKTTRSQNYNFKFNEGERVVSATEYQKDSYGEKEFSYSSIQNVAYKKCETKKDEAKSNADSTVYSVTLYFDVDVKQENSVETRSTSTTTYQVAVPYTRVYKHQSPGITDMFVKVSYRDVKREILSSTTEKVSFTEYEIWSLSGEKNAKTISKVLNFGFTNPSEQTVYTENTDYQTTSNGSVAGNETSSNDGNWTIYTKTNSYSSTANNGHKSFNNKYAYSSQKAVYKCENYTIEFGYGSWTVNEGESTVGAKSGETTYNGTTYEVYPYVNNVSYKYDVTTDSYNGNGKSDVKVCVVKPEEDKLVKKAYRDVKREILSSTTEKVSFTEYEIWSVSGEKNAKTISKVLNFGFTNPSEQTVYTENTNYQTTSNGSVAGNETSSKDGNWTIYTKTNSYSSTANNGHKSFNNKYSYNSQKAVYKNDYYTVEFGYGSWNVTEGSSSVGAKNGETTYNGTTYEVYPYVNNVSYKYDVTTDSYSGNGKSNVKVCVVKPEEDKLVKKAYRDVNREIISSTTEKVSFTEYEIWSVSGEKNSKTISKVLNFGFNNPSEQTVYTENTNYQTTSNGSVAGNETSSKDGNWTVYTKTNSYSSTANNGHKSFNNKYSYSSQKAVYSNEYYTVEFAYGNWSVNEGSSSVGAKNGETTYNGTTYEVYPYVNNVSYVYDVTTDSYSGNGKSDVKVCVEKAIEPSIIPSKWGKILGAGISAVPSDDESGDFAKKCICIRTEKGAVSVVFNMNTTVPTVDDILSANFVEGNYGSEYNSGIYTSGNWVPAEARDLKDRIAYYINGEVKRNVRHTTLKMWNWRDGNLSTVVDGYSFSVSADGTLTVNYNGQTVLSIR